MRKLIVGGFVTLDGVIEKPWEWAGPFFDAQLKQASLDNLADTDTFLMGRETYERFSSTWPHISGEAYFDKLNAMDKFVVSNTLKEATWNTKVLSGDVADKIRKYKQTPGKNITKYGIGKLDEALLAHGLIDEYYLSIIPITLKTGKRLFEGIDTGGVSMKLKHSFIYDNGVVSLTYIPTKQTNAL